MVLMRKPGEKRKVDKKADKKAGAAVTPRAAQASAPAAPEAAPAKDRRSRGAASGGQAAGSEKLGQKGIQELLIKQTLRNAEQNRERSGALDTSWLGELKPGTLAETLSLEGQGYAKMVSEKDKEEESVGPKYGLTLAALEHYLTDQGIDINEMDVDEEEEVRVAKRAKRKEDAPKKYANLWIQQVRTVLNDLENTDEEEKEEYLHDLVPILRLEKARPKKPEQTWKKIRWMPGSEAKWIAKLLNGMCSVDKMQKKFGMAPRTQMERLLQSALREK